MAFRFPVCDQEREVLRQASPTPPSTPKAGTMCAGKATVRDIASSFVAHLVAKSEVFSEFEAERGVGGAVRVRYHPSHKVFEFWVFPTGFVMDEVGVVHFSTAERGVQPECPFVCIDATDWSCDYSPTMLALAAQEIERRLRWY